MVQILYSIIKNIMKIKTGCDLVAIKSFKESMQRGGQGFLNKVFSSHELSNSTSEESLAGIFAAKEAVKKALDLEAGNWQMIEIVKEGSGKPQVKLMDPSGDIQSSDISISHHGDYVMATAAFLIN